MPGPTLIHGGRVHTPEGILAQADVLVVDGNIAAVGPALTAPEGAERIDATGLLVIPGMIDSHLHGGLEDDTMDGTDEAIEAVGNHLVRHGITGWLPTTVACGAEELDRILSAIGRMMTRPHHGARVLGAHLESNFLAPKFKGAQPPEHLRPTDDPALMAVLEKHHRIIRVVTLAPELPGAEALIRQLVVWGITVSVGHTDATYDQVLAGVAAGATRVTHLCNAMRPFHHREPGTLGAALVTDALTAEVIVDLVHVHPAGVQIAYRCKGADGLMLVSDALRGAGLPPGTYELGGHPTTLDGSVARLQDGTIAGSVITLEKAIANAHRAAGIPLEEAVHMATAVPARMWGLGDRGAIAPGRRADLTLLDDDFNCRSTMIEGAWVHRPLGVEVTP
jgi:N-acetylglucosamine-6-phosphate deacetylase